MQKVTIEAFKKDNNDESEHDMITVGLKSGTECKGSIVIDDGFVVITQGEKVTYVSFEDIEALTGVPVAHVAPRK